jgi:hypothetical protein
LLAEQIFCLLAELHDGFARPWKRSLSGVTAEAKTQLCLHCVFDKSCVGSGLLAILKAEAQLWLAKGQKAKAKAKHKSVQNAKTAALKV